MRTCRLACWAAVWLGAAHSQGRSGQELGEPGAARRRGQEQGYDEELDLWINFAPSDAEEVEGHLTDAGALFDENRLEAGFAFGWETHPMASAMSMRDGNAYAGGPELNSLVSLGAGDGAAVWKIALENGWYEVSFSVGDPAQDSGGRLSIQGTVVLLARSLGEGETAVGIAAGERRAGMEYLEVTDGFLRVGNADGLDTASLNWLRIQHSRLNENPRNFFVGQFNVPIAERGTPDGSARDEVPVVSDCDSLSRDESSRVVLSRRGRQYCENRVLGGGWTLVMKVSDSSDEFWYGADHWSQTTVLNPEDRTVENGDAKFPAFNTHEFTEWMAVWPDFEDGGVWHIGPFPAATSLDMFQTHQLLGENATLRGDFNGDYFSTQPGYQLYGINQSIGDANVRWGYSWSQLRADGEPLDLSVQQYYSGFTSAAGGGIGLSSSDLTLRSSLPQRRMGAGDWFACPGGETDSCGREAPSPGAARRSGQSNYRVQIFGRGGPEIDGAQSPAWVRANVNEAISFSLGHYAEYARTGQLMVRSCLVYSDFAGIGEVAIRLRHTNAGPCVDDANGALAAIGMTCGQMRGLCGDPHHLGDLPGGGIPGVDGTMDQTCPVTCDKCDTGGEVHFEDVLPATSADQQETKHACGLWHNAQNITCGTTPGQSCQVDVIHEPDAQLFLYDLTLEVAVIDAQHSLEQFHVGRFDVQVAHSGAVGNEWTTVSTETGFGIDLSHYADYIRAPFDVFPQLVSFEEAEHECVEYGGHLASVHTDAELEALAEKVERAGLGGQQVFIGAFKNATEQWQFVDGSPYDEVFMASRNFLVFGDADIMSMVVYPEWRELYGSPVRAADEPMMPFACSRTHLMGVLHVRACAVFAETGPPSSSGGGSITMRLRNTDQAGSTVYMEETFAPSPDQLGVVRMECGRWYDATTIRCGNTWGTSCQVDMMHSSPDAEVKLYEFGIEVSVDEADSHSTTHYSGRIPVPIAAEQLFDYASADGGWMDIGARDGLGVSLPAYTSYGNQNVSHQLIRFCAVYTDIADGGGVSVRLRSTDPAGGAVWVESLVGSATRSLGSLVRTECGGWNAAASVDCDVGCKLDLKHSSEDAHWTHSRNGSRDIRVYSVDIEVGSCYPGYSLIDGECVANACTGGLTLANSDTICAGKTGDGCIFFCHEGFHFFHEHTCMFNGNFEGGVCRINQCRNFTVAHSTTTCAGFFQDECVPECDYGYTYEGFLMCQSYQRFEGGRCAPNPCVRGNALPDSPSVCVGTTTDVCQFDCNPGWTRRGQHVCLPSGDFSGGYCEINQCLQHSIVHSPTICNGDTFDVCPYTCRSGYRRGGDHICQPNGRFQGGECVLDHPCEVEGGTLGADNCHADATCARTSEGEFDCFCNEPWNRTSGRFGSEGAFNERQPFGGFYGTGQDCDPWTECVHLESYEISAPTHEADRVCATLTTCDAGEHEVNASSYTSDRACALCPPGRFQPVTMNLGEANDRQCLLCLEHWTDHDSNPVTPCRQCPSGTYQPSQGAFGPILDFACPLHTIDHDYNPSTPCVTCPEGYAADMMQTECHAIQCREGIVEHSGTVCIGSTDDQCNYVCDQGYTRTGNHTCMPGAHRSRGRFEGGQCLPNQCVLGLDLPHSQDMSACAGRTTTETCEYDCLQGYHIDGVHECHPTGAFVGGRCAPNECTSHGYVRKQETGTVCTGNTGDYCQKICNPGYIYSTWALTEQTPGVGIEGYHNNLTRRESNRNRALGGYADDGATRLWRCNEDGTFGGGDECVPRDCWVGRDFELPTFTNWGTCPTDGTLPHGSSCNYGCENDLDLHGSPIQCNFGNFSRFQKCAVTWEGDGWMRNRYILRTVATVVVIVGLCVGGFLFVKTRIQLARRKQKKADYDEFGFYEDLEADDEKEERQTFEDWLFQGLKIKPFVVQVIMQSIAEDPLFEHVGPDGLQYVDELFGDGNVIGASITNQKLVQYGVEKATARKKILDGLQDVKLEADQKVIADKMKEFYDGTAERPILEDMKVPLATWLETEVKLEPEQVGALTTGFEAEGVTTTGDLVQELAIDGMLQIRVEEKGLRKSKERKRFIKQFKALKKSIDAQTVKVLMGEQKEHEFDSTDYENPDWKRLTFANSPLNEVLQEVRAVFKKHDVDLREAFKAFDLDGDGVVSTEEFRKGLSTLDMPITKAQAEELIAYFDKDNSGDINADEFIKQFGDEVAAEKKQEATEMMAARTEELRANLEAEQKQAAQEKRVAERTAARKYAKLEEFVKSSTISNVSKIVLLKNVKTREQLANMTKGDILAMHFEGTEQVRLVQALQQQAELHFKKKAALNDTYHSSEEERLSDEEELTSEAEAGRRAYEEHKRKQEAAAAAAAEQEDAEGGAPVDSETAALVEEFLAKQKPAELRSLCEARGLSTKGLKKALTDSLKPVLATDAAFVAGLRGGEAPAAPPDDDAASETSESESEDESLATGDIQDSAAQLRVDGDNAMAKEDFKAALDFYTRAQEKDPDDPKLRTAIKSAERGITRQENTERIRLAQEAREQEKKLREEERAKKAAEAQRIKDLEAQRKEFVSKGEAAIREEDFEGAIKIFEEGLLIDAEAVADKPTRAVNQLNNGIKKAQAKINAGTVKKAKKLMADAENAMRRRNFEEGIGLYEDARRVPIDQDSPQGKELGMLIESKLENANSAKAVHAQAADILSQAQEAAAAGDSDGAIVLFTDGAQTLGSNTYTNSDHTMRDQFRTGLSAEKAKVKERLKAEARGEPAPATAEKPAPAPAPAPAGPKNAAQRAEAMAARHLDTMRPSDLRQLLTDREMETKGLKKDLVARLAPVVSKDASFMAELTAEHRTEEKKPEPEPEPEPEPDTRSDEDVVMEIIGSKRPNELRTMLAERGLDKKGLKKDLIERLKASLLADSEWIASTRAGTAESTDI